MVCTWYFDMNGRMQLINVSIFFETQHFFKWNFVVCILLDCILLYVVKTYVVYNFSDQKEWNLGVLVDRFILYLKPDNLFGCDIAENVCELKQTLKKMC